MEPFWWMVALWVDGIGLGQAPPALLGRHQIERVNSALRIAASIAAVMRMRQGKHARMGQFHTGDGKTFALRRSA